MAVIALLSVELIVFIDFQVSDHKVAPVGYSRSTSIEAHLNINFQTIFDSYGR